MTERQPAPILVRQADRDLPERLYGALHDAPPVCVTGALFVDELYRERRISSVEWRALRDPIWPTSPGGAPCFEPSPLLAARVQPPDAPARPASALADPARETAP